MALAPSQPDTPHHTRSSTPLREPVAFTEHVAVLSAIFGLAAAIDVLALGRRANAIAALGSLGCGVMAGAIVGLIFAVAWRGLARVPTVLALGAWSLMSVSAASVLLYRLGVVTRLGTKDHVAAVVGLAGGALLAISVPLLAAALQPHPGVPRGWIGKATSVVRFTVAAGFVAAAVACIVVDRTAYPHEYAVVHSALRYGSILCFYAAYLGLCLPSLAAWRSRKATLIGASAAAIVSVLTLTVPWASPVTLHLLSRRPFAGAAIGFVRQVADFDFDGYAPILGGGDCAPFDRSVHPFRQEVPGNGVDDNCLLGDAPRMPSAQDGEVGVPAGPSALSVVLITVDTLSAPRMHLYGGERDNTPHLDEFAKQSVVFDNAFTSGGWTSLAMSSLFRGVYPRRMSWTRLHETTSGNLVTGSADLKPGERFKRDFALPLADPRRPLAWWLERRGMTTAAVVNDRHSEFLDPEFFGEGFEIFVDLDEYREESGKWADDRVVTRRAISTFKQIRDGEPFFLWVHYFGPHKPDEKHGGWSYDTSVGGKYDHEIKYLDEQVGKLIRAIDKSSQGSRIAIIVTADHGEIINRTRRAHGNSLATGGIRIPLILRVPGASPARRQVPASLVDVFPTVLALTETPAPGNLDGLDLRQLGNSEKARILVAETWRFDAAGRLDRDYVAALDATGRLVQDIVQNVRYFRGKAPPGADPSVYRQGLEFALDQYIEATGEIVISPPD